MYLLLAKGIGYLLIVGSAAKMFQTLNKSVVIEKSKFRDIEKRIRADERNKIQMEQEGKENKTWLLPRN